MFFDWGSPLQHINVLLQGAFTTIWLTILTFVLSFVLGTLVALARFQKKNKTLYIIASCYVELIRNTPALVQIFLIYFGLPQFGIQLPPLLAGIAALSVNNSAYIAEMIRAGMQSIPRGQWEASSSLGLTNVKIFRFVIFPQAIRNVFPALSNQFIAIIVNGTILLSVLDIRDLFQQTTILTSQTFRVMETYIYTLVIYCVIAYGFSLILKWVNRRFFPSMPK